MPPRPRHSRISSCGKRGAICSAGKGGCAAMGASVKAVSLFRFNAMRQWGQRPAGALAGRGAPPCGHFGDDSLLIPDNYRRGGDCYMILFSGKGGGQMAQFFVEIGAIGEG